MESLAKRKTRSHVAGDSGSSDELPPSESPAQILNKLGLYGTPEENSDDFYGPDSSQSQSSHSDIEDPGFQQEDQEALQRKIQFRKKMIQASSAPKKLLRKRQHPDHHLPADQQTGQSCSPSPPQKKVLQAVPPVEQMSQAWSTKPQHSPGMSLSRPVSGRASPKQVSPPEHQDSAMVPTQGKGSQAPNSQDPMETDS